MGCWNETCGITQMPICAGDKVRMFFIVKNNYSDDSYDVAHSYTTDLWKPFGLPIKGTYDEYGRIENIEEDAMSDLLLESIREMIIEVPNRMGKVFKREKLDWETVIDFLTDEGFKVVDPFSVKSITKRLDAIFAKTKEEYPDLADNGYSSERSKMADEQKEMVAASDATTMYHMMVHEDIYQALARKYKAPAERFSSWTDGNLRKVLELDAQTYLAKVREDLALEAKFSIEKLIEFKIHSAFARDNSNNRFVRITNHLTGDYASGSYLRKYLDFIENRIKEGAVNNDPLIQSLTDQFIDFACFNQCMCLLRKMWAPQCGKGGQDREYVLHKFLGNEIALFSEKKMKEYDDEYADIDEEDNDIDEDVATEDELDGEQT